MYVSSVSSSDLYPWLGPLSCQLNVSCREERGPDTWNDVRPPSSRIPEVADMPRLQNGHLRFLPAVSSVGAGAEAGAVTKL